MPVSNRNTSTKKQILLYVGDGAGPIMIKHTLKTLQTFFSTNYIVTTTTAKYLTTEPDWESRTALLVIPGGRDLPYVRDLSGTANKRIVEFVTKKGGKYLGLCAGGYYASDRIEFEMGTPLQVAGPRELKFFPGLCKGCVYPGFDYRNENGARAIAINIASPLSGGDDDHGCDESIKRKMPRQLKVYYNGGGYYVDAKNFKNQKVRVWATYAVDRDGKKTDMAAIVARKYQRGGFAVVTGLHPEVIPTDLNPKFYTVPENKNLVSDLTAVNGDRVVFLTSMFMRMGLKV
ncbi:hypothetical protein GQ42DRAFT_164462, partial [Ramicandelaber brevisporus]